MKHRSKNDVRNHKHDLQDKHAKSKYPFSGYDTEYTDLVKKSKREIRRSNRKRDRKDDLD